MNSAAERLKAGRRGNPVAERLAAALAATFPGPDGRYLRQTTAGDGWTSYDLTPAAFRRHVEGRERIGRPFDPERLAWATFDLDGKIHPEGRTWALTTSQRIAKALADLGLPSLLEQSRSGSGFHLWMLFDANGPTLAAARELAGALLRYLELPYDFSERPGAPGFYPWPARREGCGRVPYLPLHGAANGKTSGILCDLTTGEPFANQLQALEAAPRISREGFEKALSILRTIVAPARSKTERKPVARRVFSGELTPYAEAALRSEVGRVTSAGKGERHRSLFSAARNLGELVGGGELPRGLVESNLRDAASAAGILPDREREVENAIRDGIDKGLTNPRRGDAPGPRTNVRAAGPAWIREELDGPGTEEAPPSAEERELEPDREAEAMPELPAECWRHGFSQFRDAFARCSEAADGYLFGAYLVLAGLALGRQARLDLGFDVFPNVYVALVGDSGRSRKSTAQGFGRSLLRELDEGIEHSLGVGSPEGLVKLFVDDAKRPRRVLLDCGELTSLIRKGAAEATRGLLPMIVDLYDCPPSTRLPNAKTDLEGRDPYLCIVGGTTVEWFAGSLSVQDARAGFAGRFMLFTGRPKGPIPWPPPADLTARSEAVAILRNARDRHATPKTYPLATNAREVWAQWYYAEKARPYPSETLEVIAQRLPLFAWKLALVFAALEGCEEVTREHLAAGIAFADYQRAAQSTILGGLGDSAALKIEDRIRRALARHGPQAGWQLTQRIRRVPAETLARALRNLGILGVIEKRQAGKGTVWALSQGQRAKG